MNIMNILVLILSVVLIGWISIDTFNRVDILENHQYMVFQFWVCLFFMADFFITLGYAHRKWRFFWRRILFFILSIPFLNIVNLLDIQLSKDVLYFVRFIPLARGALALTIVLSYISKSAVTSLFVSYLVITVFVAYFCSLVFYQREAPVNPEVNSYWTALWWAAMNLSTVGCDIAPVTAAGKIVAVILPITGMIIFPLFTVYLTDSVVRMRQTDSDKSKDKNNSDSTDTSAAHS